MKLRMSSDNVILLFTYFKNAGGTERATINLANNFVRQGKKVTIISAHTQPGDQPFFSLDPGVAVVHLGMPVYSNILLRTIWGIPRLFFKIKQQLRSGSGEVISTTPYLNFIVSVLKRNRVNRNHRYIGCQHVSPVLISRQSLLFSNFFYKHLDALVVLSKADADYYVAKNIRNIHIIPNEISFYPEKYSDCSAKRIIAIGRLSPVKRFVYMIEAAEQPLKANPDWTLEIVGEGDLKQEIEACIRRLGLEEQVILHPFTSRVIDYYRKASLYLLTSETEGFPMVLLEAQACGLPIIAHDCPSGPREIINSGEDGILTPFNNQPELVAALNHLIVNDTERKKMGVRARANVLRFSSENIFRKWEELFVELKSVDAKKE